MASYASVAEFKAWKRIGSTDASDDTVIQICLDLATDYINSGCGRAFTTTSATRYYDVPVSTRTLKLDTDLYSLTSVTNGDGSTIPSTEFVTSPRNDPPYYAITLKPTSTYYWIGNATTGNTLAAIGVVGTWGYSSSVPSDVKAACLAIATNVYSRRFGEGQQAATITPAGLMITPQDVDAVSQATIIGYLTIT